MIDIQKEEILDKFQDILQKVFKDINFVFPESIGGSNDALVTQLRKEVSDLKAKKFEESLSANLDSYEK